MMDQEELVNMISRICIQRGFGVAVRSGGTPKRKRVVPGKKIIISCRRSVLARPSTRISDGTSTTNRPITVEDKCNFSISLYQCPETKRFFLRKFGDGCKTHSGHYKLQPNQVKARSAVVEKEEMKRVINQLNKNIPTEAIRTLLQQQTGITLSPAQIRKLRQKIRDTHMMHGNSPAQRLINAIHQHNLYTPNVHE